MTWFALERDAFTRFGRRTKACGPRRVGLRRRGAQAACANVSRANICRTERNRGDARRFGQVPLDGGSAGTLK